jgi:hypothetical protein
VTTIDAALRDLLNEPTISLDDAIDRHFVPGYRQRTNGSWDDRAGFAEHIAHLRNIVRTMTITVIDEISDGHTYADRHIVDLEKTDGSHVVQEVYLFGALADDGRFERVEETTLMLAGTEHDRTIAGAR